MMNYVTPRGLIAWQPSVSTASMPSALADAVQRHFPGTIWKCCSCRRLRNVAPGSDWPGRHLLLVFIHPGTAAILEIQEWCRSGQPGLAEGTASRQRIGLTGKITASVAGLGVLFLWVMGLWLWFRRSTTTKRQQRRAKGSPVSNDSPASRTAAGRPYCRSGLAGSPAQLCRAFDAMAGSAAIHHAANFHGAAKRCHCPAWSIEQLMFIGIPVGAHLFSCHCEPAVAFSFPGRKLGVCEWPKWSGA